MVSHRSWCWVAKACRYHATCIFVIWDGMSVCGWNTVDMSSLVCNLLLTSAQKSDVKRESLSLMISWGTHEVGRWPLRILVQIPRNWWSQCRASTSAKSEIRFRNQTTWTEISQVSQKYETHCDSTVLNRISESFIGLLRWPISTPHMWNLAADSTLLILHLKMILSKLEPLNLISFARTVFAAWSPSPFRSPSAQPWQLFRPLQPDFTCSILYFYHCHHPGHHNLLILYTKPYRNHLFYCWISSSSKMCKSSSIDSQVGSIDSHCQVHLDAARVLEAVQYWHSICCSTASQRLTLFDLLQINSDWLTGRLNQFVLLSTSRWCKDAGIQRSFALNMLLYGSSSRQGRPLLNFSRSTLIDSNQQNENLSGSHSQTSQTSRWTSLVLQSTSRCSQAPLELSKVLSDSARAILKCSWKHQQLWRCVQDATSFDL